MERRQIENNLGYENHIITGYASVFFEKNNRSTEYNLFGNYWERIAPNAFSNVLNDDVVALFNHSINEVIGRTPNTLKLRQDNKGLYYEVQVPTRYRWLEESIQRGDIRGSSFGFIPDKIIPSKEGDRYIRTIVSMKRLVDVSPVVFPAYSGSDIGLRSQEIDQIVKEFKNYDDTQIRLEQLKNINRTHK